jgi:hypothetical protein
MMLFVREKGYGCPPAVQRQQRKSDVMKSFGLTACSAVYYHAGEVMPIPAVSKVRRTLTLLLQEERSFEAT